ncbi:hypothetical protein ACGF12_24835 [Kitasatospora sp. NPDC048296]|uniref:hypothetical protein n=1 Tax=Kitasatospora sp. NPDC048296 TaxID=3364048 RepID=UPI00371FA69D
MAILPEGHRLAARDSINLDDPNDEVFPQWPGVPDDGNGPKTAAAAELISLGRIGRVVAVVPHSLIAPAPAGIVCVPVADAGPSPNRLVPDVVREAE